MTIICEAGVHFFGTPSVSKIISYKTVKVIYKFNYISAL